MPESKEVVYLQPQKQRVLCFKKRCCFEVLLNGIAFKNKSKFFSKNIWQIKKKHCIFAAAYSGNKFPKILKRNPG
ncbi:hypothetical protein, partial [Salegentibacter holothuriorum]|uniref:hypothetical protein n=1 Tax=Salegentibacter holothuriorum TaxID=241145 RepID=UPI001C376A62